ncbi:MAG TPA: hypothetical protein VN017_04475, partial [Pseudoxanthomonas sp.]|nr:hypothetical protein [Pseudoxanthomonas sp.]
TPTPTQPAKIAAHRGFTTVVWKGGVWGSNNPYPQPASYKIRRIRAAMAEVGDWYPETAEIVMAGVGQAFAPTSGGWRYSIVGWGSSADYSGESVNDNSWSIGKMPFGNADDHPFAGPEGFPTDIATHWGTNTWLWARKRVTLLDTSPITLTIFADNIATVWVNGTIVFPRTGLTVSSATFTVPSSALRVGVNTFVILAEDDVEAPIGDFSYLSMKLDGDVTAPLLGINPAHWLYYLRTHDAVGREPIANMNDASWRAAADKLYDEGFGICVEFDPSKESLEEHEQRICKLIGGSVTRSLIDGQYYLDLARELSDAEKAALPILTDDDILRFREQPSTFDGATNSVSVKYFDPERKEDIITPPDADLALVDAFGMIHQVNEYPEIPTGLLASRLAYRDRLATTTPTRAFDLDTKRTPYGWRPGTYFRLQLPKRGIADMVCVLAEKQAGTLQSGAIRIKATQDIYSLPAASFIEIEPGSGSNVPRTATPISLQLAFEAPYIEAAQRLPRAELAAVPAEVGYLQAVAADLAGQRDYTMMVADAGGEYAEATNGQWCPVAETGKAYRRGATVIQLGAAIGLDEVAIGSAGMWDDEIVRVDAKDMDAGTITFGRGCADTTPAQHDAASRIWFYDNGAAIDTTEYTDGETVDVKLLSNTVIEQLALADATAMPVTFNQRLARPYPPAKLRLNAEADPAYLFGVVTAAWVHRDRVLQADQLVDTETATIGPEAGTTYTMRTYVDNVLDDTQAAIAGNTASVTPSAEGFVRIEIEAERDGLTSWQAQVREFYWTPTEQNPLLAENGELITTESGEPIFME